MHMLLVLLWKHKRSRLNNWLRTGAEIFFTVSPFLLFYFLKGKLLAIDDEAHEVVQHTEAVPIDSISTPGLVLCYPQSTQTEIFMKDVGKKLSIKQLNREPVHGRTRGYYFINNASYIPQYAEKLLNDEAIVIFQNMDHGCPEKLNYTIRIKDDFKTNEYIPADRMLHSHSRFGTMYETFMKLQWAVDSAFLRSCLRSDVTKIISFQEFPNKQESEHTPISIIVYLAHVFSALLVIFIYNTVRIMEERESGVLELMKISGVSSFVHGLSHFFNAAPIGALFSLMGTIVLTVGDKPVLPKSSAFLLLCIMFLTFASFVALAFMIAHALPLMQDASNIASFIYILLCLPSVIFVSTMHDSGLFARLRTGLFPFVPLQWVLMVAAEFEAFDDRGLTFKTLFDGSMLYKVAPYHGFLSIIIQIGIFSALAYYMSLVRPGRNGVALPWNFLITKVRKLNQSVEESLESVELNESDRSQDPYFEVSPPPNQHGIKIRGVTKFFDRNKVLNNINMNIYEGEITVLLGHNGAGKTTLMTIVAGLQKATSGKVYVEGMDITTHKNKVIKLIGVCPQDNIFFKDLNVLDHAMFFTMIRKDSSVKQARAISESLLGRLNLDSKEKSFVNKLSGGMKRRLQLCMAMAGDARVLVLDEPTSGLDVETRRDLWNLLLTLRGNRTVVLSTHFMEEADALGDRIAALHTGELKCYATPMFLKKAIGEGYRLTLVTLGLPKEPQISYIIFTTMPEATLKENTTKSLSYNLPSACAANFSAVFEQLEKSKAELGIESIGLGTSTLDEVFMRLCSDTPEGEEAVDTTDVTDNRYKMISGCKLIKNQTKALMWRHYKYLIYKKWNYLIFTILFPLFLLFVLIWTTKTAKLTEKVNVKLQMDLDLFGDLPYRTVVYNVVPEHEVDMTTVQARYPDVVFEEVDAVADDVLRTRHEQREEYNRYLLGLEVNQTHATVFYTTNYRHAAPVALNLLSNSLAFLNSSEAKSRMENPINVYNDPVEGTIKYDGQDNTINYLPKSAADVSLLGKVVPGYLEEFIELVEYAGRQRNVGPRRYLLLLLTISWCFAPLFSEKENSQRHILMMSGCSATTYWLLALAWYTLIFVALLLPAVICLMVALDNTDTYGQFYLMASMALLILLSIMSFLAFMFWLTELISQRPAYVVTITWIGVFNYLVPLLRDMFPDYAFTALDGLVVPLLFNKGTVQICNTGRVNKFCELNRVKCPGLNTAEPDFKPYLQSCCESTGNAKNYMDLDTGLIFVYLLVNLIVYMILTIITQKGFFAKILEYFHNNKYIPVVPLSMDETVENEKKYVAEEIKTPQKNDAMLVHNLHKRYVSGCCPRKKLGALQGVSFSIKQKECFAILGINGAGKTTMFQALTAEIPFTSGTVVCNGHKYSKTKKYLHSLGYCPQHNSMDIFLTGQENLEILLMLRGYVPVDAKKEAKNLIKILALEKHGNKLVYKYSGGCRRRLAAGGALCGATLSVLDEPSSGVDVAARRALWAALRRPHALLVASHSMEEVEALASRVLILAGGMVRALGTAAELRAWHASGHSLRILLNAQSLKQSEIGILKEKIKTTFKCTLKDEHQTMLYYHINETKQYSYLFNELETLKATFSDLIVDYSVQETTLEEVFLSFAKETNEGSARRNRSLRMRSVLI